MQNENDLTNEGSDVTSPRRITFGFKEGFLFGVGLAIPLFAVFLMMLGILFLIP